MPLDFDSSVEAELDFYFNTIEIDGAFVDCPETALNWRKAIQCEGVSKDW